MKKDLSNYRKHYSIDHLLEEHIAQLNPIELFDKWFKQVEDQGDIQEVNAMSLSTIGEDGSPESRMVLLKEYQEEGFIFYTNYYSKKATSISNNPKVCLSFFWPSLQRQVIIKGEASKLSEVHSAEYFSKRPRESQLAAWSSRQSQRLSSRGHLEETYKKVAFQFEGRSVEKPPHWGGYIVNPYEMQFWQGRKNRLHDRICYTLKNNSWSMVRLYP